MEKGKKILKRERGKKVFILQKLCMPDLEVCSEEDMYYRIEDADKVKYDSENKKYVFEEKGIMKMNTYFNSFSSYLWSKYSFINKVGISLDLQGEFEISFVKFFLADGEIIEKVVKKIEVQAVEDKPIVFQYDFSLDQIEGAYFIKLRALADDGIYKGGCFYTDQEVKNDINISVVICTYKREKYVYRNLQLFQQYFFESDDTQVGRNIELFVIDNAGTLDDSKFENSRIHLVHNKNVGGAGGFTRGIIESLKANRFSHIILMDDDALIDINSFEKTYAILSFLKKEYLDLYIGGATLRLDKQNIQLESGAVWNNNILFNIKNNLNLSGVAEILLNEQEESRSYNAWVFNCIPICTISENNLPMPLFVRGDDMEYGMRNAKKILTMNGICAWHVPLHHKYSSFMQYYVLRNQLVLNALYDKEFSKKSAIRLLKRELKRELVFYRYENVDLIFKAFEDFLGGIDFFLKTDGEQLHKEIMHFSPNMKDFHELSQEKVPFIYEKLRLSQYQQEEQGIRRFIQKVTWNGYLFPFRLYKRGEINNYGVVEASLARPVNFYRKRKILQVDLTVGKGFITEIKKKKLLYTYVRYWRMCFKMWLGAYNKAVESYRQDSSKITNLEFWNKYLNIGG